MTITIDQLVQREVKYNVSKLIDELAYEYGDPHFGDLMRGPEDYENAARDEGWYVNSDTNKIELVGHPDGGSYVNNANGWKYIGEDHDIDPYYTDILEYWIVSDWLADELIAKGETVAKDFMGLTIWARTTSGQSTSLDYVIQLIYGELVKET